MVPYILLGLLLPGRDLRRAAANQDAVGVLLAGNAQPLLGLGGLALAVPHRSVEATFGQKLGMPAALDDAAVLQDDDLVGRDDGRQPVRDHDGGAPLAD